MKRAIYILAACLMAWIAMPQHTDAQTLRNASNATIGKIDSDGTVRNASNAILGKISSDGTVRNASNATIGKADGVNKQYAAAVFFFFFFKR